MDRRVIRVPRAHRHNKLHKASEEAHIHEYTASMIERDDMPTHRTQLVAVYERFAYAVSVLHIYVVRKPCQTSPLIRQMLSTKTKCLSTHKRSTSPR